MTVLDEFICTDCGGPLKVCGWLGRFQRYAGYVWRNEALKTTGWWKWRQYWVHLDCKKPCSDRRPRRVEITREEFFTLLKAHGELIE